MADETGKNRREAKRRRLSIEAALALENDQVAEERRRLNQEIEELDERIKKAEASLEAVRTRRSETALVAQILDLRASAEAKVAAHPLNPSISKDIASAPST